MKSKVEEAVSEWLVNERCKNSQELMDVLKTFWLNKTKKKLNTSCKGCIRTAMKEYVLTVKDNVAIAFGNASEPLSVSVFEEVKAKKRGRPFKNK